MKTLSFVSSEGSIRLGGELGAGGEGSVYAVLQKPSLVAKVYSKQVTPDKAAKLIAMQGLANPQLRALTAWPTDVLRSSSGQIVGFLMANLANSKDIHRLYSPKSRLSDFPNADWRVLVRVALNTARAFAVLHDAGCVVGDVNHGGVRVGMDATVTLIDCDSFQISAGGRVFHCEVGVDNFTPPELQQKSFAGVVRTANHDNFGLAVLIFLILQMGRHPFAGRYSGQRDLAIGEAIEEYRYAYSSNRAATAMLPPPNTVAPSISSPAVADMWERAFGRNGSTPSGRPSAREWIQALSKLETSFARCSANPAHYYFSGCSHCPWCPVEKLGLILFGQLIDIPSRPKSGPFDINAVWAQISSIAIPSHVAPPAIPKVPPSPTLKALRRKDDFWQGSSIFAGISILIAGFLIRPQFWHTWAAIAWAVTRWLRGRGGHIDLITIQQRYEQANASYDYLSKRWISETATGEPQRRLDQLRQFRHEWLGLPAERRNQYEKLVANRRQNALHQFLDKADIEDAKLSGIGPAKKAMLQSYGIETAADITRQAVLQVPGFGSAMTDRLLQWKAGLEAKFRFDPQAAVDPRQIADLDRAIGSKRARLEEELHKGSAELARSVATITSRRKALEGPLIQAAQNLAQAKADLEALSP